MFRLLFSVTTLFVAMALLLAGHGMQITVIPLRAASEGFSAVVIGLLGSTFYAGFIVGALVAPRLIRDNGHIRSFAILIAVIVAVSLAQPLIVWVPAWIAFRTATGACLVGIYLIVESWLNAYASNTTRGLLLSAYVTVDFIALAFGQFLVAGIVNEPYHPFTLAALVIALGAIPVLATRMTQPAAMPSFRFDPRQFARTSPVGVVAVGAIGVAHGCVYALGPIFAIAKGLDAAGAAAFMGAIIFGGALSQAPAGRLSDRYDRRAVLMVLVAAAAVLGILIAILPPAGYLIYALAVLFGAAVMPTYAIAAAHIYDRTAPEDYVAASSGALFVNGIGSVIGPFVAALVMRAAGDWTLLLFVGMAQLLLLAFIALRLRVRPDQPVEKTAFAEAVTLPGGSVMPPDENAEVIVVAGAPGLMTPPAAPEAVDRKTDGG